MKWTYNFCTFLFLFLISTALHAQPAALEDYSITWTTPSANASESMPCGGGDIGLNVWVEKGALYFYMSRSGTFDENNTFLKLGRVRVKLSPDPFKGQSFMQKLVLADGSILVTAADGALKCSLKVWVDVFKPVVHVEIDASKPVAAEVSFEQWRYGDLPVKGRANNANSWKWAPQVDVVTRKDDISFSGNGVLFYHRNATAPTVFDYTVKQQGLDSVKHLLHNPLQNLTFGGYLTGSQMKASGTYSGRYEDTDFKGWSLTSNAASRNHDVRIVLYTEQAATLNQWLDGLERAIVKASQENFNARTETLQWWRNVWNKSFINILPGKKEENNPIWQAGRNYQLFRYMLACNAYGMYPTKFNGGLFTYDPAYTDTALKLTPDFRNWGGGTHTAQNQRLVYFPMLRSGDFSFMKPQFEFYLRLLRTAELRSAVYWDHHGASFTEQLENFGLPNPAEYGWNRPGWFDKGVEYNAWLEYQWDTVLEFCLMMLEVERYTGENISGYLPFIESCLRFFDEHYQYRARQRGRKALDANGDLILYPGSAAETFKMAYNASSTIAALTTVTKRLLELPSEYLSDDKRKYLDSLLQRIPPIPLTSIQGHSTIAPARLWERINNVETPQLYPVYPWGIFGLGRPDLETARNTWAYDTNALKFRGHTGWKQDNIFAARLGLTEEAARLTILKLQNSGRRFPAFWGPGFDWTPDHNWGGSGMIGLQEMLLQTDGRKIFLFPAWPKEWDVHFKLFAPYRTTVEAVLRNGKIESLIVLPESRKKDIIQFPVE